AFTCGTAGVMTVNAIGVCPASADWIAGPEPPNGMCTRSIFCDSLNSSPDKCGVVPRPAEAKLYLPGLALRNAASSMTVFAGIDGWTLSRFGDTAASVTGAKSL